MVINSSGRFSKLGRGVRKVDYLARFDGLVGFDRAKSEIIGLKGSCLLDVRLVLFYDFSFEFCSYVVSPSAVFIFFLLNDYQKLIFI